MRKIRTKPVLFSSKFLRLKLVGLTLYAINQWRGGNIPYICGVGTSLISLHVICKVLLCLKDGETPTAIP